MLLPLAMGHVIGSKIVPAFKRRGSIPRRRANGRLRPAKNFFEMLFVTPNVTSGCHPSLSPLVVTLTGKID
jgi:hypothetical protein